MGFAGGRCAAMLAEALTPADIFGYHVRYVVPLFQRPYVWNRRDQWEPLWDDVRSVADRLLQGVRAQHFLGAVVVEQAPTPVGAVTAYHVIDGQQRLTTLQLLLDAARRVCAADGDPADARALRLLVANETARRRADESVKVWPTLADRDAFLAAVCDEDRSEPPIAEQLDEAEELADDESADEDPADEDQDFPDEQMAAGGVAITQAHTYFREAVIQWAGEAGAAQVATRLA